MNPDFLRRFKACLLWYLAKYFEVWAIKAKVHDDTYNVFSSINIFSSSIGAVLTPLDNTKID